MNRREAKRSACKLTGDLVESHLEWLAQEDSPEDSWRVAAALQEIVDEMTRRSKEA